MATSFLSTIRQFGFDRERRESSLLKSIRVDSQSKNNMTDSIVISIPSQEMPRPRHKPKPLERPLTRDQQHNFDWLSKLSAETLEIQEPEIIPQEVQSDFKTTKVTPSNVLIVSGDKVLSYLNSSQMFPELSVSAMTSLNTFMFTTQNAILSLNSVLSHNIRRKINRKAQKSSTFIPVNYLYSCSNLLIIQ
jgi:hypothetical protein